MIASGKCLLISYALLGLVVSIAVGVMNSIARASMRSESRRQIDLIVSRKMAISLCLCLAIAIGITFVKFRTAIAERQHNAPHCYPRLSSLRIAVFHIYEESQENEKYPKSIEELFAEMEEWIVDQDEVKPALICPRSKDKQPSFEFFNPESLKPGIEEFIILYEKPNNHPSGERTVLFNTGKIDVILEEDLHGLLSDQSQSRNSFKWQWSTDEEPSTKSWWERERDNWVATVAGIFAVFCSLPMGLALFLGLKGLTKELT
jgi:hypothetical protein